MLMIVIMMILIRLMVGGKDCVYVDVDDASDSDDTDDTDDNLPMLAITQ